MAHRLGVIATAGELAIEYGVLPWPRGHAEKAAAWAFRRWVKETGGGTTALEDQQAVARVRELISQYGDSRFDHVHKNDPAKGKPVPGGGVDAYAWLQEDTHSQDNSRTAPLRYGFRRGQGPTKEWCVFPQVWEGEFCKGFDPKHVASVLSKLGKLKRKGANTIMSGFMVSGQFYPGYILTSRILDHDEPEEEGATVARAA